jgi:hypothetical protein
MALLAQTSVALRESGDIPNGIFIILAIAAGVAIALTAIVTGIKHATKERELEHVERMKALEQGVPLEQMEEERRFRKGLLRLAFAIGAVVPICAVGSATGAVAGLGSGVSSTAVFLIWTGAAAVGVAGVASGAWLAQAILGRLAAPSRRTSSAAAAGNSAPYPHRFENAEAPIVR